MAIAQERTINISVPSKPKVTDGLLAESSQAIDQSSLAREIVERSHRIRSIEQISGPSRRTQTLRQEIARLEDILKNGRGGIPV